MTRTPIMAIWLLGGLVALLAYAGGVDQVLAVMTASVQAGTALIAATVDRLDLLRPGVMRALAVGLFVTFAALALLAIRRGKKGRAALVLVTLGFLWSVDGQDGWLAPLLLAATAAAVMTARLRT